MPGFTTEQLFFSPLPSCSHSLGGSHPVQPTPKEWGVLLAHSAVLRKAWQGYWEYKCQGHLRESCVLQKWDRLSISAILHPWLGTGRGNHPPGADVAMGFRMWQLGLWSHHPPCSQRSARCLLMEAEATGRSQRSDPLTVPAKVSANHQTRPQASAPSHQRPQISWNSNRSMQSPNPQNLVVLCC